jgi:hypothetical protein
LAFEARGERFEAHAFGFFGGDAAAELRLVAEGTPSLRPGRQESRRDEREAEH